MPPDILRTTSAALGVSASDLEAFSVFYNSDYSVYGNEVYDDIKVRLVHLENFLQNNWWNNRFYFLWRDWKKYNEIIDIGFSVPYLPLFVRQHEGNVAMLPNLIYVDGNTTSMNVSEVILKQLGVRAEYVVGSALHSSTWKEIQTKTRDGRKLFTAFETIEHFDNPQLFWNEISAYRGGALILSLPIGPKIPSHTLAFENEEEVLRYLEPYLQVREYKVFDGTTTGSAYKIFTCTGEIK
jgi:hypothetical protein